MVKIPEIFHGLSETVVNNLLYNSLYLPKQKLHYIATPKAACTTFKWWIAKLDESPIMNIDCRVSWETTPEMLIHDLVHRIKPSLTPSNLADLELALSDDGVYRFAVVRNPYSRIFSAWASKILTKEPSQIQQYMNANFLGIKVTDKASLRIAFEDFLLHILKYETNNRWINPHWTPQSVLLCNDRIKYSQIYQVENIDTAIKSLTEHLINLGAHTPKLERLNENLLSYSPDYLSKKSIELIQEIYNNDFQAYNYNPNEPPEGKSLDNQSLEAILSVVPQIIGRNIRITELIQAYNDLAKHINAH